MSKQILEKYRNYFSADEIKDLHPYQIDAIKRLLDNNNCLTVVPTGGGKSLVFQLTGLEKKNTTLIVSPLKALMQEQVNYLNSKGISSIAITSDINFQDQRKLLRNLGSLKYKFIYVSPERLQNFFFRAAVLHSGRLIDQLVIDEAHCISQWGADFRPEYAEINKFLEFLNENKQNPVICALTATLSPRAATDIKNAFNIKEDIVFGNDKLIRPELELNFQQVIDRGAEEVKWDYIIDFIKKHESKKALIYFYSRKKAEDLSNKFNIENPLNDLVGDYFHAGLSSEEKLNKYIDFKEGRINILFTTTAFGMGMNIPNIDCIIQYHLPKSIEEYYQQVGRGARVKEICPKCNCLLFWSEKNIIENKKEIEKERFDDEIIKKGYEHLNLRGKINELTSVSYSALNKVRINLPKLIFNLEKQNVLKIVGEINGGPESIRFKNATEEWNQIKYNSFADSFILTSEMIKKPVSEMIKHIYEQDLKGNVEFLPAMKKILFMKEVGDIYDVNIINNIISNINEKLDYQMDRFNELENLCRSENPYDYLSTVFKDLN
ncbi:MAG: RecQ family ATP-dependent DNA helicase [Ignavibacteriales bacterium]|nr:RecQ family ATP-dependent DNA helicase [Ignavibacteriales bacterium]